MSLEHCHIVPMPDLISRVSGDDHLSIGPARYVSFAGHAIDAQLLLNGEPLSPLRAHTLGVSRSVSAEGLGDVVVDLTVPFDGKAKTFRNLSQIVNSKVSLHITGGTVMFHAPRSHAEEAFYEAVPLLLPKKLHHSAGALLNFANVMAFYLPK